MFAAVGFALWSAAGCAQHAAPGHSGSAGTAGSFSSSVDGAVMNPTAGTGAAGLGAAGVSAANSGAAGDATSVGAAGDAASTDAGMHTLYDAGGHSGDAGGHAGAGGTGSCDVPPEPSTLQGWASVKGSGVDTTTGGGNASVTVVTSLKDLNTAAGGDTPAVIHVKGELEAGDLTIGSNKTIVGLCGAKLHGHVRMNGSVNVILRNLFIVGYNCTDNPKDCSGGADAITVQMGSHHLWFDHDDISDGSDGNLDMTHASDFITISWTKFHYSGKRVDPAGASGGHQFSNLIGHSDSNASEDTGHLRITFHHDHWADNVVERMPRVRFGQVHLFDNLYTATGNDYCIGVGHDANVLSENDVFVGVKNPIDSTSYSNAASIVVSHGNVYTGTSGTTADKGSAVFTPGYKYTLDPAAGVQAAVTTSVGPH